MSESGLMSASRLKLGSRANAAALAAALLVALSSAPARAQFSGYWGWRSPQAAPVPSEMIYGRLLARGFDVIGPLRRNGGVFLADVQDRSGRRERLVMDAYSGAVLQTFAYAPPRLAPAEPNAREYAPGPSYARYPRDSLPPNYIPPGMIPEPGAEPLPPRESKAKRPARKVARREVTPKHAPPPSEAAPSDATREPGTSDAGAPPRTAAHEESRPARSPSDAASQNAQEAAVGSTPSASKPAAAAIPASKPASGPGFAHGVPINPLD